MPRLFGEAGREGLSDALYYYKQGALDFARIRSLLHRIHEVDYLPPCLSAEDMTEAAGEDYTGLLDVLIRETQYDLIVADLGCFLGAGTALLGRSDRIFMPLAGDTVSRLKVEAFEDYLRHSEQGEIQKRIQKLTLPDPGPLCRGGDYLDALLLSPLGDFVREMVV